MSIHIKFVTLLTMKKWAKPSTLSLFIVATSTAAISFLTLKSSISSHGLIVVPAIEEPIKIRPRNTSCMPFIKKEPGYSLEFAIPYEKHGNEWVRPKDNLNHRQLENKKGDEKLHVNVSEHLEKMTIDPQHTAKDKSVIRRASSIQILKSCNNDI